MCWRPGQRAWGKGGWHACPACSHVYAASAAVASAAQMLEEAVLDAAEDAAADCQLFITAGTSAVVGAPGLEGLSCSAAALLAALGASPWWQAEASARTAPTPQVYPAAGFARQAAAAGAKVAEFNLEPTSATWMCDWAFQACGTCCCCAPRNEGSVLEA